MPKVTVKLEPALDGSISYSVKPPTLVVPPGTSKATIRFVLKQKGVAGYSFPSEPGSADNFFGIQISGDDTCQFTCQNRVSDTEVVFMDANGSSGSYTYSVTLASSSGTLRIDPTIQNQGQN